MTKSERAAVIESSLREDGFRPEVDNDGDVEFKCEGKWYAAIPDDDDDLYYVLVYHSGWEFEDEAEHSKAERACVEVANGIKAVKMSVGTRSVSISIETFQATPQAFADVLPRCLSAIQAATRRFRETMAS